MALKEATLPLILYRKVETIEHVIVRTLCYISIPCFITFSASAIPTPFFIFNVFSTLYLYPGCHKMYPTLNSTCMEILTKSCPQKMSAHLI